MLLPLLSLYITCVTLFFWCFRSISSVDVRLFHIYAILLWLHHVLRLFPGRLLSLCVQLCVNAEKAQKQRLFESVTHHRSFLILLFVTVIQFSPHSLPHWRGALFFFLLHLRTELFKIVRYVILSKKNTYFTSKVTVWDLKCLYFGVACWLHQDWPLKAEWEAENNFFPPTYINLCPITQKSHT